MRPPPDGRFVKCAHHADPPLEHSGRFPQGMQGFLRTLVTEDAPASSSLARMASRSVRIYPNPAVRYAGPEARRW